MLVLRDRLPAEKITEDPSQITHCSPFFRDLIAQPSAWAASSF
jgi:hypothetical protein